MTNSTLSDVARQPSYRPLVEMVNVGKLQLLIHGGKCRIDLTKRVPGYPFVVILQAYYQTTAAFPGVCALIDQVDEVLVSETDEVAGYSEVARRAYFSNTSTLIVETFPGTTERWAEFLEAFDHLPPIRYQLADVCQGGAQ